MRNIYMFVVILISTSSFSQLTYIPNSSFEEKLIYLGYDSGPIDHYVPTANISGVTSLTLDFIGSITGIEDFVSLTELHIYNYSLQSLNLSQNIALKTLTLDISGYELHTLDLSNNTALTTLDLYSNTLNNVNFSNNTALTKLTLGAGFFGSTIYHFDVSPLVGLTDFRLYGNVTSIDLTTNTLLQKVDIRTFDAPLTILNLASNTLLTDLSIDSPVANDDFLSNHPLLENLYVKSNSILEIDASVAPNLKSVRINSESLNHLNVEQNSALDSLSVDALQMRAINLTNSPHLTYLYLRGGYTSLDLSQNHTLKSLALSRVTLPTLDLSQNQLLEKMTLYSSQQLQHLDLSSNTALTRLDIYNNYQLAALDLRNGNNQNIQYAHIGLNPMLTCVYVDNKNANYLLNTEIWSAGFSGSYVNNEADCSLGISNKLQPFASVYPNPVKNTLYIETTNNLIPETIIISDATGKVIEQVKNASQIDVSSYETGLYFMSFPFSEKKVTVKFIKM